MLLSLRIENFALIDSLDLQFGAGLNVLTGETGAGKSIILDAIDAVLGGKVSGRMIRTGAERAVLEAQFPLTPELYQWCQAAQIEVSEASVLVCSREIGTSGQRNRSRVNGVLVNKQQMQSLRDRLVEITAQGQTMQLGDPALQRDWLDSFGGEALQQQRQIVSQAFAAYQQALRTLEQRRNLEAQRQQQLDLFEYQLKELKTAQLSEPEELEQLEIERNRLSHSVDLQQQSYQLYQMLYQNDSGERHSCCDLLGDAERIMQDMVALDPTLSPILEAVSGALTQIEQAGRDINLYGETIETDPQRLQEIQERITLLKQILRKYGPSLADAIRLRDELQGQVDELTGNGQSLDELEAVVDRTQTELLDACARLTQLRQETAQALEVQLIQELKPLAMDKVQFQVSLMPIAPTASGSDRITYLFSPNPGEPLQPLAEVASGGEMSRFLLALQACFSQMESVGTLVFDEIDVGVSGRVAGAIAQKLHHLSHHHQVLCVTHQPIVAAMADHHYRVSKQVITVQNDTSGATRGAEDANLRTVVSMGQLDQDQRRQELATIAGGDSAQGVQESARVAIDFADSLLAQAAALRQSYAEQYSPHRHEPTRQKRQKRSPHPGRNENPNQNSNPSYNDSYNLAATTPVPPSPAPRRKRAKSQAG
jgi:DNA repair protein RecN (Recombination protein N)